MLEKSTYDTNCWFSDTESLTIVHPDFYSGYVVDNSSLFRRTKEIDRDQMNIYEHAVSAENVQYNLVERNIPQVQNKIGVEKVFLVQKEGTNFVLQFDFSKSDNLGDGQIECFVDGISMGNWTSNDTFTYNLSNLSVGNHILKFQTRFNVIGSLNAKKYFLLDNIKITCKVVNIVQNCSEDGRCPYGFNGYESDNESKGEGNSYTTQFRQYDPRLGRWLSVDPIVHHWQSPYNSYDNNPIFLNDPHGSNGEITISEGGKNVEAKNNVYIYNDGTLTNNDFQTIVNKLRIQVSDIKMADKKYRVNEGSKDASTVKTFTANVNVIVVANEQEALEKQKNDPIGNVFRATSVGESYIECSGEDNFQFIMFTVLKVKRCQKEVMKLSKLYQLMLKV
jgi:RHS repeat-associated protein